MPTKLCLRTSQGSLIQYKEQHNLAFKLLVKSQMLNVPIGLDTLMSYPLSPVSHCLGTPDGFFAKINKASMLHFIMEDHDVEEQCPKGSIFIQDGNALFHTLNNLPPTFDGLCPQILDHMVAKQNFIFDTDSYHQDSIKSQERVRCGCGEQFILQGSATRKPKDFKTFLTNDENKRQLCEVLLQVWSSSAAASSLKRCNDVVIIVDRIAHRLLCSNKQVIFLVHFHISFNFLYHGIFFN